MRKLLIAALFLLAAAPSARAQQVTRICVESIGANGSNNCAADGWLPSFAAALAGTVTAIRASGQAQLGGVTCYNPNASAAYVQVFDAATAAAVTLGTTASTLSIGIPPSLSGSFVPGTNGVHFASGIQWAATTTPTGSTPPSTGLACNALYD